MHTSIAWRWTSAVGVLYAIVGALFVLASFDESALGLVNAWLVPDRTPSTPSVRLYTAVMGAVVIGLGVLLARVAASAQRGPASAQRGPAAIARALRDGLLVWFVVDTTASLLHGSWQNAAFNVASLAVGLPAVIIATRNSTAHEA